MKNCRSICSLLLLGGLALGSCSKDGPEMAPEMPVVADAAAKEAHKERFAAILSKAVYEREDLRAFLKKEALVQFDKNYDVFYPMVKDRKIGGESFREVLLAHSSEQELAEIERNVPLLNILLPEIAVLDIWPKDMDVADEEIPVAIAKESATALYLNGVKEGDLDKGEVPGFHLFVVNENRRVELVRPQMQKMASTRDNMGRSIPGTSFVFKDPEYDGIRKDIQRFFWLWKDEVDRKTIEAYKHFYKDDGGPNQKGYQRDYVYYGITPQNPVGNLNTAVREYISFIEIDPAVYYRISDQACCGGNRDPYIHSNAISYKGNQMDDKEVIRRMWVWGSYSFVFDLISPKKNAPIRKRLSLRPDDLWDFHLKHERIHSTWFRKAKHTHWINPDDFTAKRYDLRKKNISFGPWNIAEEGLYRYVNIYEEDDGIETTISETYEMSFASSSKFKNGGTTKEGVGLSDVDGNTSSTIKQSLSITRKWTETSDDLGTEQLYFYDPLIVRDYTWGYYGIYLQNFYNTGSVKFGIEVR